MTYIFCPSCEQFYSENHFSSNGPVVKVPTEEMTLHCPTCDRSFSVTPTMIKDDRVKVAQYGGIGSGGSAWAPGNSPFGSKMQGGWNSAYSEDGLEAVMSRTHTRTNSDIYADPKMNIEKQLEPNHAFAEQDAINYDLTPKERERLRIKKQVMERTKFYGDALRSVDQNSVKFIQTHFKLKPEHLHTREEALEARRTNKDERESIADQVPMPQDSPQRSHSALAAIKYSLFRGVDTVFDDSETDDERDANPMQNARMQQNYLGNYTPMNSQNDVDHYLGSQETNNWSSGPDSASPMDGPHVPLLWNEVAEEQGEGSAPITQPADFAKMLEDVANDPKLGTQGKLQIMHSRDNTVDRSRDDWLGKGPRYPYEQYPRPDESLMTSPGLPGI